VRIPALKEQRRTWFLAHELHTPGGVTMRKDDLGWAWHWMMDCAPYMKLNSDEETFELQPGFNLVVTVESGQLKMQATGQGKVPVYAESETKFFPTVIPAEIEFFKDDQGKVTYLILHQNGHDLKAPRK